MAIVKGSASTLEQIAARLKEINEGATDVSKLLIVEHEASGLMFRVGPMSRTDYDTWDNLKSLEDLQHESSGAAKKNAPRNSDKSDAFLLTHAVFSEDGSLLTSSIADLLFTGKGFGPSTRILCAAASTVNPPRHELVSELRAVYGFCREMVVFLRIVTNGRMESQVTDFLVGNEEEKAAAARSLGKIEETLPFWEGVFDAQDAAKEIDVDVYERMGTAQS